MWNVAEISPGVWAGFTDVTAGNLAFHVGDEASQVAGRRAAVNQQLADSMGQHVQLAYMHQVHGTEVACIGQDGDPTAGPDTTEAPGALPSAFPVADALVAVGEQATARGLAVMVADCVPVVLAGQTADGVPVVAVAHAGRPGVEHGVVAAVVARMKAVGAKHLAARLGPSVCGRCYEVPDSLRARVSALVPEAFATTSWGTPALDLPAAVIAQLQALGVTAVPSGSCTMEDPQWFSHRRSQQERTPEGRFIGFVATGPRTPPRDAEDPAPDPRTTNPQRLPRQ